MSRKSLPAEGLYCFSTDDLLGEIRRRALGCMVVVMRAEESGDTWRYALKGSPVLLGAMSAALNLEVRRSLPGPEEGIAVGAG